jgi:hypothetical protein
MRRLVALALVSGGILLQGQSTQPRPIVQILNAASHAPGMPGGGALATILVTLPSANYVQGLQPGLFLPDPPTPFPPELDGILVLVNGAVAPVQRIQVFGFAQPVVWIDIQVPMERNATLGDLNIGTGSVSPPGTLLIISLGVIAGLGGPGTGGFFKDANGYLNAQHASDGSWVTVDNPAHAGEQIIALADDFFSTWPPPPMGVPVPQQSVYSAFPLSNPDLGPGAGVEELVTPYQALYLQTYVQSPPCPGNITLPSVCFYYYTTTRAVTIDAEGLAPGMVGIEAITFTVPTYQQPGDWALFFNTGSCPDGRGAPCPGDPPGSYSSPYALLPVR